MTKVEEIILQLTDNAKMYLVVTGMKTGGDINGIATMTGGDVDKARKFAKLESIIEEFLDHKLISGKNQIFNLTDLGWNVFDKLKK